MRIPLFTIALFVFCFCADLSAQGCSDAGICSVPVFRPGTQNSSATIKSIRNFGMALGVGDHNVLSLNPYLSTTRYWGERFGYDFRVSLGMKTGNSITVINAGDANLGIIYRPNQFLAFSTGIKLPLADAKRKHDDKPLPMDYQTSLGTVDLIAGLTYRISKWLFVLAYQQPVTQNENEYDPALWPSDSILSSFQQTTDFQRRGDVMARIAYPFQLNDRLLLTAGLVPIYHLDEDEYFEEGVGFIPIEGSDGLTINASLYVEMKLREKNAIGLNLGFPLLVRKVRPDGLTRSFVLGVEYQITNYRD